MRAAIVGGGAVDNYSAFVNEIKKYNIIICADGGIKHLINADIPPDVFIGDLDSCNFDEIKNLKLMKHTKIIKHNPIKNDTDMQLCIDWALENNYKDICIFAALGGRIDHELSNILNLRYILDSGARGMIFSDTNRIYITKDHITVQREKGYKISLVSITDKSHGITLNGLYYPLLNAELSQGSSLGISNEFLAETAEITVMDGVLLVIVSKDNLN